MSIPASTGDYAPGARPNSRTGLGYGQIVSKFHKPKQQSSQYPYQEEDDAEVDVSDIPIDIQSKIRKIVNSYLANDFLAINGTDPFYYVAGNTKLGELASVQGLSPIPGLYKNRIQVGGGANSPKAYSPGSLQQTGSTIGYSHPHRSVGADNEISFFDLGDDEDLSLKKVRLIIKNILGVNES